MEVHFLEFFLRLRHSYDMQKIYDNILIGGSGFIGSVLAEKLAKTGESVVNISRHSTEFCPGIDTLVLDVSDRASMKGRFPTGRNVFILIGQSGTNFDANQELRTLENLIDVLNQTSPEKVFYLSSALVYGERATPAAET